MLAFTRLTSILLFVLSLSFLVSALPTSESKALAARHDSNALVELILDLQAKVDVHVKAIRKCFHSVAVEEDTKPPLVAVEVALELVAKIGLLIADINACATAVLAIGANIDIDASVKADIGVKVAAIISVIVKLCIDLVAKFGIFVVGALLVQIDLCLKVLISNLGVCVDGLVAVIAEIVVNIGVSVLASVKFDLCIKVLGFVGVNV
ncbi:hypothetical protein RSOLAG1IB_07748 [Rhizoctonia solani AG-1 IB]|uniref:Transmembrane protein n=1 Tax=Thanatephorus cucumeris (strain AG1-IB / isolate 7/3/14) TaxID=1108050 RepID=A0A0B7FJK7_THACB|nr:hypothetical protein RSOLAG1IB_07748 [Rhizoctonia solani AG-1 IB]